METFRDVAHVEEHRAEQEVAKERVEIPYQAVTALVIALSYRDANTAEHCRRVADLCARAADGLFDRAEAYVTKVAALLPQGVIT